MARTRYQRGDQADSGCAPAVGANKPLLDAQTGGNQTVSRSVPKNAMGEITFSFSMAQGDPGSEDLSSGSLFRCQLDVTVAGATLSYSVQFHALDATCTSLGSVAQEESAFTGTGLKLATATWDPPSGADRYQVRVIVTNSDTMNAATLTLRTNNANAFYEIPDAPVANRRARVSAYETEVPTAPRRVRLSAYETEVPAAPRRARVSAYETEVPIAPRRGRISAYETELPTAPRRARISAYEFETPTAPRRIRLSAFEQELPDASTTDRRVQLSAWEVETPAAPRRARLSATELEIGTAPRRVLVSAFEQAFTDPPRRLRLAAFELETPPDGRRRVWVSAFEFGTPSVGGPTGAIAAIIRRRRVRGR